MRPFNLTLDDPSGQSIVESTATGSRDPALTSRQYPRTAEQVVLDPPPNNLMNIYIHTSARACMYTYTHAMATRAFRARTQRSYPHDL